MFVALVAIQQPFRNENKFVEGGANVQRVVERAGRGMYGGREGETKKWTWGEKRQGGSERARRNEKEQEKRAE